MDVEFGIFDKKLTTLNDMISSNTEQLTCDNNNIFRLENLHQSLIKLSCNRNKIVRLDNLPKSLTELFCYTNPLEITYKFKPTLKNILKYNLTKNK